MARNNRVFFYRNSFRNRLGFVAEHSDHIPIFLRERSAMCGIPPWRRYPHFFLQFHALMHPMPHNFMQFAYFFLPPPKFILAVFLILNHDRLNFSLMRVMRNFQLLSNPAYYFFIRVNFVPRYLNPYFHFLIASSMDIHLCLSLQYIQRRPLFLYLLCIYMHFREVILDRYNSGPSAERPYELSSTWFDLPHFLFKQAGVFDDLRVGVVQETDGIF